MEAPRSSETSVSYQNTSGGGTSQISNSKEQVFFFFFFFCGCMINASNVKYGYNFDSFILCDLTL
jgi:hypothetical protein